MAEYLDVVNGYGEPTGETVERDTAHAEGIPHRTSHVWLLRENSGVTEILLQKRAENKTFPGCYDISSAGHIPAGNGFTESALRELKEELGVSATEDELISCGDRYEEWDDEFFGKPFHDRQYMRVFLLWKDIDPADMVLQEEEVEGARWIPLDECITGVIHNGFPHCIALKELLMVKRTMSGLDYLYTPEKCPCPRGEKVGCPRHRNCEGCVQYHRIAGNPPMTACEKKAEKIK